MPEGPRQSSPKRAFAKGEQGERFLLLWLNDEDGSEIWEWYTTPARFAAANYDDPEDTWINGEAWSIGTVVE